MIDREDDRENSLPESRRITSFRAISSDRDWRPSGCAAQGREPNSPLHGRTLPAFDAARHAETERRLPRFDFRLLRSFVRYATARTKEAARIAIARPIEGISPSSRVASSPGSVVEILSRNYRDHLGNCIARFYTWTIGDPIRSEWDETRLQVCSSRESETRNDSHTLLAHICIRRTKLMPGSAGAWIIRKATINYHQRNGTHCARLIARSCLLSRRL